MVYRYYTFHRPIDIGTIPMKQKPLRIYNYPEGRKEVVTADGRHIMAWGEVEYKSPLTDEEVYNYELVRDLEYIRYRHVGYWMNDANSYEIIEIENKYYVLHGWNGEKWCNCWECLTKTKMAEPDVEYTLTPIYFGDTDAGTALMETMWDMVEGSAE